MINIEANYVGISIAKFAKLNSVQRYDIYAPWIDSKVLIHFSIHAKSIPTMHWRKVFVGGSGLDC